MIISNNKTKKKRKQRTLMWLAIATLSILLLIILQAVSIGGGESFYFCDMETTVRGGQFYKCNGQEFGNASTQSRDKAFSGKYSAKCDEKNIYGPGMEFKNVYAGDVFEASVWRQSQEGFGVLAFQGDWGFYQQANEAIRMQNGWELIKQKITIPIGIRNQNLKIFPYNTTKIGPVYFDDLKIRRIKTDRSVLPEKGTYSGEHLNLQVEERGIKKLNEKRLEAYKMGNLITDKKDLVPSKLQVGGEEIPVKIRLKGDLLDHLKGKKWSFRIICDDNSSWKGMSEFSVHNTASRHHIAEWIFHEMLKQEDILSTRYDFVEVALNDETLGIYAFEEHFKNALLRHQNRQLGPIIRINEDAQWHYASHQMKERPEVYQSTQIETFEAKKVFQDESMTEAYRAGQNLLYEFMKGLKKPTEVFDVERLAKYIAILDVCLAYHAFSFTNIRFYYNPVTAKLEPIGYDGYTDDGTKYFYPPTFSGAKINARVPKDLSKRKPNSHFHYYLFNDLDFTARYGYYLEKFTSEDYIHQFLEKNQAAIEGRVAFIQREYSTYQFQWDYFSRNAKAIRDYLFPMEHISLKAYRDPTKGLMVESYHYLPLEIVGFGNNDINFRLQESLTLEAFSPDIPVRRYQIPYRDHAKFIFFKTLGTSQVAKVPINKWQIPEPQALVERGSIETLQQFDFLNISKQKTIVFKTGKHSISKDVIIPKGYEVRALPNTELQLENGAAIISYSPVFFEGEKEKPISISSADGSGQGFAIINAPGKSFLRQVIFHNLSPRNKNGQITAAAVTVHQSDVHIERCYFMNLKGKDALGIIRSEYFISDCLFENTQSDALDLDFSSGQMESSVFQTIGKDAIEISGGWAKIYGTSIKGALGTGLNLNLQAKVEVGRLELQHCHKGVAVTDLSEAKINQLILNDVEQGMLVYKRLAEFGNGHLEVEEYEANRVEELQLVEEGAKLILGKTSGGL